MKTKPGSKGIVALLSLLLIMAIAIAGCAGNKAPTAYIDSIVPPEPTQGVGVTFTGHGTDSDGTVVAYRWTSSIDGEIGTSASFTTSSLSVGSHTISFRIQDNNDVWSENVTANLTVAEAIPKPVILSFDAEPGTINPGRTSTLSWEVTGAATVSIDHGIGNVALSGTRDVSPSETTTYTLVATNEAGSVNATAQITVQEDTLEINQTAGIASAWFGASPVYVNVGQGQSFQVTEAGFFSQFQIYLTSSSSSDSGDIIVCDLRDASGNVLQSVSIHGFTAGGGGWQTFNFNLETYVTPGTYYGTCYVSNPVENHGYSCHGNSDDTSYPAGTRYASTGGNPEDWSTWFSPGWDLLFKVIIKTGP